jgi:hypothetical protein
MMNTGFLVLRSTLLEVLPKKVFNLHFNCLTDLGPSEILPIHILTSDGRNIGRFDIEHQCPMDDFRITKRLRNALIDLGYMLEESGK